MRYGLRSLLAFTAVACFGLWLWSAPYHRQDRAKKFLEAQGAVVAWEDAGIPSFLQGILGDKYDRRITVVNCAEVSFSDECLAALAELPWLTCLLVAGDGFADSQLDQLHDGYPNLKLLVLDTTLANDPCIVEFQRRRDVAVYRSDRLAFDWISNGGDCYTVADDDAPPQVAAVFGEQFAQIATWIEAGLCGDRAVCRLSNLSRLERFDANSRCIDPHAVRGIVTDKTLQHLSSAKSLTDLDVTGNPITSEGLKYLVDLPICRLLIAETEVDDDGFAYLLQLRSLTFLHLGHKISRDGVSDFVKAMRATRPHCSVVHGYVHLH